MPWPECFHMELPRICLVQSSEIVQIWKFSPGSKVIKSCNLIGREPFRHLAARGLDTTHVSILSIFIVFGSTHMSACKISAKSVGRFKSYSFFKPGNLIG